MNLKRKHFRTLLISLFAGLLFTSCQYAYIETEQITGDVSYSEKIQPAFDSHCISCHVGTRNPVLLQDVSYNNLINGDYINLEMPEESKVYIKASGPHSGVFTPVEAELLLTWIQQGALDN